VQVNVLSKSQASNQFTMVKSFAFLVVTAEAATCTGTKDLVVSEPQCYHGFGQEHYFTEDVYVKIADFGANGGGHMEVTGGGMAAFTCSNKVFTKSGLKITTDLSDCLIGITIPEIDFCSGQDAVKVTVKADAVVTINVTLSRVACSGRAQHHLALSQVLTSRPLKQYMEEPVQQHAALRDEDCYSAKSGVECNNKGCCWDCRVPIYPICFPCGANDAVTGVAEQELGLALSRVLTSRPLKQYAALGNSFTADDSISGVVEQEPDMALV